MPTDEGPLALWLVPVADERRELQDLIDGLAAARGTVPFVPHVTLFATRGRGGGVAGVENLLAGRLPVRFEVLGLGVSPAYFKSLYLDLAEARSARQMWRWLAERHPADDYSLAPHLSLLYEHSSLDEKRLVRDRVGRWRPSVTCDELWQVEPRDGEAGWEDVAGWQVRRRWRLPGC